MPLLKRSGRGLKGASGGSGGRQLHGYGEALVEAFNESDWDAVLDVAYEFAPDLFEEEGE